MSETKTEAKPRAPFKWLIPIQTSKTTTTFGRPELQAACRGSEDMAIQLNYFAYEASSEAQNNKIDIEQVDFIRIIRSQDEIMKGILNCVSKKTHIKQMAKFEEWGFITSDAYHHTYDIYFKKIAEVIANPPPAEKRKPRGRHVSQKVKSTNSEVKSTNCKLEDEIVPDCTFNPNEEMVNLQNQIVKLQIEMVNLQNQIVKLQIAQSYESAPRLALSGFCGDADSIDYKRLREIDTYVVANAIDDTPIFSFPVVDSEIQVSDESFKVAVLDDWKVIRPAAKITTSSQALEQILNRLSNPSTQELSTPVVDTPSENVENVEPTQQSDIPTESKQAESYSQQATQNAPAVVGDAPPSEQKPARPARTPRPPKTEDETVKARVEKVFAYFDTLLQETTGKPDAKYARTKKAYREIKDTLLPCAPTEQRLRKVYMKLWKTPANAKSTFVWKEHMKIDLICGQYENLMIAFDAEEQKEADKQKTKQVMDTVIANPSLMAQQEEDLPFDINRIRGNSHRGRRSAS